MNTTKSQSNHQQQQNNQRQKTRQQPGARKRGHNPGVLHEVRTHHEHECPELRMTR